MRWLRRAADLRSNDVSRAIRAAGEVSLDDWALAPLLMLLDRGDRNLEHLFTLLALLLPEGAVRIAFRALHTHDLQLKEPLSSTWRAPRRPLRVNSCYPFSKQTPRSVRAPLATVTRWTTCWPPYESIRI
jgi:hypothetical protein